MAANPFVVNQQYMQGCAAGQQAAMAEMSGNIPMAAQLYDQAVGLVGGAIMAAFQSGLPLNDQNFFVLSCCNFSAARMKAAMGMGPAAAMLLVQALDAINRAIMMNQGAAQYHSAAGTILAAQGNYMVAEQAFQRAIQMNPWDGWSQWMLASLHSAQGNSAVANQYYAAARQFAPQLPPPQASMPQWNGAAPQGNTPEHKDRDWFGLISEGLKLANNVFDAFGGDKGQQGLPSAQFGAWQ